jgi:hypothetical protein
MRIPLSFLLVSFAFSGCQCNLNDDRFSQIEDAGFPETDAGPPPPVFPLKEGDEVEFQFGGRLPDCPNGTTPGDCERTIKATYIVSDTKFQDGRWTVEADFYYEGTKDVIEASAIAQLLLENGAPFDQVSTAAPMISDEPANFRTDAPVTQELTSNGFPFFQYQDGEAGIFEAAGIEFCEHWLAEDPQADCSALTGDYRMETVFLDSLAGGKLHQLTVEYHPMGFICSWIEELAQLGDDPPRSASQFNGVSGDPEAFFLTPVKLRRDGGDYRCTCSSQTCFDVNDSTRCLDPSDPDAVIDCP